MIHLVKNSFFSASQAKGESAIEEGEGIKAQWTVDPEFITEFCDLTVPRGGQPANMVDYDHHRRKSLQRQQGLENKEFHFHFQTL